MAQLRYVPKMFVLLRTRCLSLLLCQVGFLSLPLVDQGKLASFRSPHTSIQASNCRIKWCFRRLEHTSSFGLAPIRM